MNRRDRVSDLAVSLWRGVGTIPTSDAGLLSTVCDLKPNDDVATYFATVPAIDVIVHGVRFMGPESVLLENTELIPGCYVSPFGFVAFASLESGEVFVVEASSGAVFLLSTEKYESPDEISPGWNEAHTDFLPDVPISSDNIKATASTSFDSIHDFLVASFKGHCWSEPGTWVTD